MLAELPVHRRARVGFEPVCVVVVRDRLIGALPRLAPGSQLAKTRMRFVHGDLARRCGPVLRRKRPHLDITHRAVAELLVEARAPEVLKDHLEPDVVAPRPRACSCNACTSASPTPGGEQRGRRRRRRSRRRRRGPEIAEPRRARRHGRRSARIDVDIERGVHSSGAAARRSGREEVALVGRG